MEWEEYIPATSSIEENTLSSEDQDTYTTITSTHTLISTNPPSLVKAEMQLKIGFGGEEKADDGKSKTDVEDRKEKTEGGDDLEYINKVSFRLGENGNVNRLRWKTTLGTQKTENPE